MKKPQNQPKQSGSPERQQARVTERDREILKSLFYKNEDLLLTVRNLFFGFPLTEEEKTSIESSFKTEESRKLMRKIFLPELEKDIPVGQSIDLWMTVQLEGKDEQEIERTLDNRAHLITMLETALKLLVDTSGDKVDLTQLGDKLIARNTFINHVEMQLQVIRTLSNQEELTAEEAAERFLKDSAK